jgi:hypothetical protein
MSVGLAAALGSHRKFVPAQDAKRANRADQGSELAEGLENPAQTPASAKAAMQSDRRQRHVAFPGLVAQKPLSRVAAAKQL